MKYKYPASINTPEAKKAYRRLKRQIKWSQNSANKRFELFKKERNSHKALKEKLKELAK